MIDNLKHLVFSYLDIFEYYEICKLFKIERKYNVYLKTFNSVNKKRILIKSICKLKDYFEIFKYFMNNEIVNNFDIESVKLLNVSICYSKLNILTYLCEEYKLIPSSIHIQNACYVGNMNMLKYLIKKYPNKFNKKCFLCAKKSKNKEVLVFLYKNVRPIDNPLYNQM